MLQFLFVCFVFFSASKQKMKSLPECLLYEMLHKVVMINVMTLQLLLSSLWLILTMYVASGFCDESVNVTTLHFLLS